MFVTRFPQDLTHFREELKRCEIVIIGNAAKRPGAKFNLTKGGGSVFFASEEDIRLFDDIAADGVKLIYQTIPNYPARDWPELRRSIKLK